MTTEASTPLVIDRPDLRTVPDLLAERLRVAPDHVAFARRTDAGLVDITTAEFASEARAVARGLIAQGVGRGDRVLVMAPTRYEWTVVDLAVWLAGGVVVPVYESSSPMQVSGVAGATSPRLAVVAGAEQRRVLADAGVALDLWTMDPSDVDLTALALTGAHLPDADLDERTAAVQSDDTATIVFTSGTTARQKGARISHANLVRLVINIAADYREFINEDAVTIIALPLAHILARGLQLVAVAAGMKVVHEAQPTRVVATFAEVRPTFMVVVPRILDKVRSAARDKASDAHLGPVFRAAEATAVEWARVQEARQEDATVRASIGLRARHALFDRLFYRRLRALLGGRMDWFLSGAAPLDASLSRFFWGIGVPVIEGYGLTETTAPVAAHRPGGVRPGTVGPPMPGSTIRIADDGEVLVRGIGVFDGYIDAEDDVEAFVDGYFRTGDLGTLDESGHLTIRGRRKHLLVTAAGKNVAPEPWETAAARSPLVSQAVLVGEGRPYLTALLLLDADATRRWAHHSGHHDLAAGLASITPTPEGVVVDDPHLLARVQRAVDRANLDVSRPEQVKAFTLLLADTTTDSPLVTPTLKLRRDAFLQAADAHVTRLYAGASRRV